MLPQMVPEHWAMSAQSVGPSAFRLSARRCSLCSLRSQRPPWETSSLVKSASSLLIPPFRRVLFRRPMCSIATHKIQSTNSATTAAAIFIGVIAFLRC
ncbi:hypothetical protein niasHT_031690 [Heterodera trifolii]|uniref:Uncharacterized protein n=1 Tax=Heterodera trifolii TaxID=157864 RepID=A0ABD2J3V5_9BILA